MRAMPKPVGWQESSVSFVLGVALYHHVEKWFKEAVAEERATQQAVRCHQDKVVQSGFHELRQATPNQ